MIGTYKCSYYSCYLPFSLAMLMCNVSFYSFINFVILLYVFVLLKISPQSLQEVSKKLLLPMGIYFTVQVQSNVYVIDLS
jgi:hypothetical protein